MKKKELEEAVAAGKDLTYANLEGADLKGADLTGANLRRANLRGANLEGANLEGANLAGANLIKANLRSADLRHANLVNANLTYANLYNADLTGANLADAKLADAKPTGATLNGADLRGADLSGANLGYADLRGADLRGADLTRAKLEVADLRGAKLEGADLTAVGFDGNTIWPDNFKPPVRHHRPPASRARRDLDHQRRRTGGEAGCKQKARTMNTTKKRSPSMHTNEPTTRADETHGDSEGRGSSAVDRCAEELCAQLAQAKDALIIANASMDKLIALRYTRDGATARDSIRLALAELSSAAHVASWL